MFTEYRIGPYQEYPGQVLRKPSIAPVVITETGVDRYEIWTPVKNDKLYLVSSRGNVKSYKGGVLHFLHPCLDRDGYYAVNIGGKTIRVHKLVADAFKGPCPKGMVIDHIDGNKLNNDAGNLQYLSIKSNTRKGTCKKVILDGVLVFDSVIEIAEHLKGNYQCIRRVCSGERKSYKGHTMRYL